MNTGENILNSFSSIFEKIIEKESAEHNNPQKKEPKNVPINLSLQELEVRNQKTYDELNGLFDKIKASNSPTNETIKYYEEFIKHVEELFEAKRFSPLQPDIYLCGAIFSLKNLAVENKVQLKLSTGFDLGEQNKDLSKQPESENKIGYKEYNKPSLTTYQVLFLMNELRKLRFTISDLNNTKMAQGIHTLTGYSINTLRPDLGKIISGEIKLSANDKNQLKDILRQLNKAVDEI